MIVTGQRNAFLFRHDESMYKPLVREKSIAVSREKGVATTHPKRNTADPLLCGIVYRWLARTQFQQSAILEGLSEINTHATTSKGCFRQITATALRGSPSSLVCFSTVLIAVRKSPSEGIRAGCSRANQAGYELWRFRSLNPDAAQHAKLLPKATHISSVCFGSYPYKMLHREAYCGHGGKPSRHSAMTQGGISAPDR